MLPLSSFSLSVSLFIYQEIYNKELADVIMEAEKFQVSTVHKWRPRRGHSIVPARAWEAGRPWCDFPSESEPRGGEGWCPSLKERVSSCSPFLLVRSPDDWMRPTTLGRTFCLALCPNVNLTSKHPQRHTQNKVWSKSGHPVPKSSWHLKSTIIVAKILCWTQNRNASRTQYIPESLCTLYYESSKQTVIFILFYRDWWIK